MGVRVAGTLVQTTVRAGVEHVYGVIGDSLNPIGDAIRRNGKLRWIHVRHEEVGVWAAGAEGRLPGGVAMCAFGILGIAVDRRDDIPDALTRAFVDPGPALVSIKTARLAAGMQQYPSWEHAKGFAKATAELAWHGHADQVVDLASASIRDIEQLPVVPTHYDRP
jgi:thiamine pyrophosphate-dependent acetolactate synthase large subunit-like protein